MVKMIILMFFFKEVQTPSENAYILVNLRKLLHSKMKFEAFKKNWWVFREMMYKTKKVVFFVLFCFVNAI